MFRAIGRHALVLLFGVFGAASACADELFEALAGQAPELEVQALRQALGAMRCAQSRGAGAASRLAVIDYSQPSSARRLWIFDLQGKRLLLRDLVAHGRGSGEEVAALFSNEPGSHQSSLGLFRTAESYSGKHGYSLRMDGLEPGLNDRARERAIVIHGADYVSSGWLQAHGRLGRSLGCPAVRPEVARTVVDQLAGGQFLFAWHSDPRWLDASALSPCRQLAAGAR
jgi:hypothetical protein